MAESKGASTDGGEFSTSCLPAHGREVCYQIPFLPAEDFRRSEEEAWRAVRPILESVGKKGKVIDPRLKRATSHRGMGEASGIAVCLPMDEGAQVEVWTENASLWIRCRLLEEAGENNGRDPLVELETVLAGLARPLFKYAYEGSVRLYALKEGSWVDGVDAYLGLDAGSISINTVVVDDDGVAICTDYTLTEGDLVRNIKKALGKVSARLPRNVRIAGAGVTGSGHEIARAILDADIYETELDAHAAAAMHLVPEVRVIFDIGGQDSKVMYIEDGVLVDAVMNRKCGAGTGAFLDAQAARLGVPVERFGEISMRAKKPYTFNSMCTVFVGRDLVSEQAKGNYKENIIAGLHRSLAMNFFSTLGINKKKISSPIVFQGGVASNIGVKKALEECLEESRGEKCDIHVPLHHRVMGALGMALLSRREVRGESRFRGFDAAQRVESRFQECDGHLRVGCGRERLCDLVHFFLDGQGVATLYACPEYHRLAELGMGG